MRKRNNRRAVKPFKKKVEIRSSKKWGNNVDEAVEAALADLGVEINKVEHPHAPRPDVHPSGLPDAGPVPD